MLDPVIKVRHKLKDNKKDVKMISVIFFVLGIIGGNVQVTTALCDKSPDKSVTTAPKQAGNGGFAIGIVGSPSLYRPGQVYTITLEGTGEDPSEKPRFTNFMLATEPVSTNPNHPAPMGALEIRLADAMVMYSGRCRNSIKESSSIMKDEISVLWTAPSEQELEAAPGSSGCLEIRAMVIERQDVWYMNDGSLTYSICKDTSFVPPSATQGVIPMCTACNEAKYELIFEGIWSRHTHPNDFPVDEWRTRFSKLIGASHSNPTLTPRQNGPQNGPPQRQNGRPRYSLWSYGTQASEALGSLARYGITRRLEGQMKLFSIDIRSVIKARGLEQRSNVAGQTFAVFRVDSDHHLLSFVTKMIPSPDWIVGVSNENLCLPNGSWTDHRTIDLYPADAGVDSGIKYNSPDQPSRSPELIQRITSSNPDNVESPFWDENRAPMKPVARLHLIKQREYEKRCPNRPGGNGALGNPSIGMYNQRGGSGDGEDPYVVQQGPGKGPESLNEESYLGPSEDTYNDPSTGSEYDSGYGGGDPYTNDEEPVDPCLTTEWSYWSQCTQTCGKSGNSQSRMRKFMSPMKANRNQCRDQTRLSEKQPCRHLDDCPPKHYAPRYINPFPPNENENNIEDYSSQWSRRGLQSGNQLRPQIPGSRPSYVYPPGPNDNRNNGNSYASNEPRSWSPRNNPRGRGSNNPNLRQGMYGPGISNNNKYTMQPYSYEWGGNGLGNQAEELNEVPRLPEQARYHSRRPQGDDSASISDQENCDVSPWGEWSDCSSICDAGSKTRRRNYNSHGNWSGSCDKELSEHVGCIGVGPNCPGRYPTNVNSLGFGSYGASNRASNAIVDISEECATADWSNWSPCSSKCSQGNQKRTRLYIQPFVDGPRSCDVGLIESQACWGTSPCEPSFDPMNYRNDQNYVDVDFEPMADDNELYPDAVSSDLHKCSQEMSEGDSRCISNYIRWYYDGIASACKEFKFTGCGGNQNNFQSRELCVSTCSEADVNVAMEEDQGIEVNTMRIVDHESDNNGLTSDSLIRLTSEEEDSGVFSPPRMGRPPKPTDCQASAWSEWTSCSKTCGTGWTTRDREILVQASPDGRACPKKLHRKRKCRQMPCPADTKYWYQGSWRHIGQD